MKQSGIDWIGEIPDGWEVKRLKNLFDFGKGLPITKENLKETGVSVISYGQIHSKQNSGTRIDDSLKRFVDESYLTSNSNSLVHKSDFIFADTSEDLEGCGNCVYVDEEQTLFAGYHTIIFSSKIKQSNKYLAYLFKTDAWRNQIRSRCNGVKLFSITKRILSNVNIVLPPIPKQESIAKMLDSKCAQIDSIIEESKKSIEEYKAWKQSVIFEAVTGKLKNEKFSDKWELIKIKYVAEYNTKTLPENTKDEFNFNYIDIGSVKFGEGITNFQNLNFKDAPSRARRIVKKDDVIISSVRTYLRAIAKIEESEIPQIASTGFVVFSSKTCKVLPQFLFYAISSENFVGKVEANSVGISYPAINASQIADFKIPLPPIHEQESIAKMLDSKCAQIDSLIAEKESLIADLTEYKKSLIFEVVTGKSSV